MAFDTLDNTVADRDNITPMQIARQTLFTAREKLDLLHQLGADAQVAALEGRTLGFGSEEIEAAIAQVQRGAAQGDSATIATGGDF